MKYLSNVFIICVLYCSSLSHAETGRSGQRLFETAEEALSELKAALKAEDSARLTALYGTKSKNIFSQVILSEMP